MSNNKQKAVFLETTVVSDAVLKVKDRKKQIQAITKYYSKKYCSKYVKYEFSRGILQHYIWYHNVLALSSSMEEVHHALKKLGFKPKRFQTIQEFLEINSKEIYLRIPTDSINDANLSLEKFIIKRGKNILDDLIRRSFRNIEKLVDEILNDVNCVEKLLPPCKNDGLWQNKIISINGETNRVFCPKFATKCGIFDFLKKNIDKFKAIKEILDKQDSHDNETEMRIYALNRMIKACKRQRNNIERKHCYAASDAIIAVEAPENADVLNNNVKHFNPICKAVGKNSIGYE